MSTATHLAPLVAGNRDSTPAAIMTGPAAWQVMAMAPENCNTEGATINQTPTHMRTDLHNLAMLRKPACARSTTVMIVLMRLKGRAACRCAL